MANSLPANINEALGILVRVCQHMGAMFGEKGVPLPKLKDGECDLSIGAAKAHLKGIYQEQREEIERAKQALEGTGIGGIYDEFSDLADAIQQMGLWIKEQDTELTSLKTRQLTSSQARFILDEWRHDKDCRWIGDFKGCSCISPEILEKLRASSKSIE